MKYSFADITPGSEIILSIHSSSFQMDMKATINEFIRDDIATITLHTNISQILNFDKVQTNMLFISPKGIPFQWRHVQIVYLRGNYILKANGDGIRHNRRVTFRVGVYLPARLRLSTGQISSVMVKDVSLTGFSIADTTKELGLRMGDTATLFFEDIGHELELHGNIKRIEKHTNSTIYGFNIIHANRDLSSYVTIKQRRKRNLSSLK